MSGFKKKVSIAICYFFMLTSILQGTFINVHAESSGITDKPLTAVDGQIIVGLRDSKYDGYMKIVNEYNGKVLENAGQDILIQVSSDSVKNALTELKADNNVAFAEVNAVGKKQGEAVYLGDDLDYLYYSHAQEAWSLLPDISQQQAVTIAVVDSGIKANHPGLSGKILTNGKNFIDNSSNTDDTNGHGTQVAGIIASNSTDGTGSIGIAGRTNVKLLPVKVLDDKGNGTSFNVAQGIRYAADNNASIINVSICGEGYSQTIQDAVNYAVNTKGCMVICSAGDKNDYAENYWPANSTGAIVIADSWSRNSNHGKVITAATCGEGKTTTIGNNQYCHVSGSSFAAAVASGTAALGKIKFPNDTNSQLENLIKNTSSSMDNSDVKYNHTTGYGIINAYAFLTGTNTPIEIVSPNTQINSNSDVSLNVKAVTPSDISNLEVYLNDSPSPITTITGNSSKNYTYTIAMSNLIDGENKVSVKAFCKSGSTYTDIRYFREYKTKDHNFSIILKGNTGNPIPQGTRVYLLDENFNRIASDTADQNGSVNFYGTNLNTNYELYYSYNNLDTTTNINQPVFFQTQINSSNLPQIIDGSSSLRKIALSAKKADGTPLLNSELYCGFDGGIEYDGVFDSTGNGYIWCSDNINQDFRLVNDSEGYILDKTFPNTIKGVNSINFAVDSTVTKVNISDNSVSGITSQLFSVKGIDDKGNYILTTVSVKNGTVYLSKNMDYQYYYENHINYNNDDWQNVYAPEVIHTGVQANININYSKPKLNVSLYNYMSNNNEFNCGLVDDYGHALNFQPYQRIDLNVLNSTGVSVDNTAYSAYGYSTNQCYFNYVMKQGLPTDTYNFKLSANIGPFGTINSDNSLSINYTNTNTSNDLVLVDIKSPIASDKNYFVECRIYDNNGLNQVFCNYAYYDAIENAATIKIDKKYFATNYSIKLFCYKCGDSNTKFMYYRNMPAVPSSKVIFDNSSSSAKPLKITIDDPAKINFLNLNNIFSIGTYHDNQRMYIENPTISNGIVNANFYVDNGSYDLRVENHNDNYLLSSSFVVSDTNSTACLKTSDLIKIGINANNVSGYVSSIVNILIYQNSSYNDISSFNIKKGGILTVSSSLKPIVNQISEKSIDDCAGNIYCYDYNSNNNSDSQAPISTDTNVNLDKFTFNFTSQTNNVDMPASISSNYSIQTGSFTLQRIKKETLFDFMNEIKNDNDTLLFNLSNSSNQIIRSTSWSKYSGHVSENSLQYIDYTIPKGTYTASIILPKNALNVTYNTFPVTVTTDNLQIVKVMNPFDLTKPAVNATVSINGNNEYMADTDGCVYVNKNAIGQASNIKIRYYDKNNDSTVIFNPDSVTPDANGVIQISKSISELKKLSIDCSCIPSDFSINGTIFTANGKNIYDDHICNQVTNFYLEAGSYSLQISNRWDGSVEKYFIIKSIDLSADTNIKIDKSQLHKTIVNSNGQNIQGINFEITDSTNPSIDRFIGVNPNTNVVYFSPGLNINASININNCINNNVSYITSQNGSNVINIGKNYTVVASNVSSTLPPDGQISAGLTITDEYSNNLTLANNSPSPNNQGIYAVINQNGQDVETLPLDAIGYSNAYLFDLKGDITGSVQVKFLIDMGSMGKITSQSFALNISTDGYTKLTIKDPLGANVANGTVQLGQVYEWDNRFNPSHTYKISPDGSIYINNSDLNSNTKYKLLIYGSTSSTNDLFVYYRDLDLNNTTYLSQNDAKVNVKSALNCSSVNGEVFVETNGYSLELKNFSYSSYSNSTDSNNWSNWNNFNLYADKGICNLSMYVNSYNGNGESSSYILCNNGINTANNSNISFDNSNLSRIKVICDAPNANISNCNVSLNNLEYNRYGYSTNMIIYASKITFKSASISCNDNQGNSFYFTKNNFIVKDTVTEIHFGKLPFNKNSDDYRNGQNINVPSCAVVNGGIDLKYTLIDADGFSIDISNNMTVKFSQNGIVPSGGLITNASWAFSVPSLPEGYYDLEAYEDTPFGKLETINQKIYIAPNLSSVTKCPYSPSNGYGIFTIYNGDTKIFTCNCNNGNNYIPNSLLDTSKSYTFNVAGDTQLYSGQLYYDSSNKCWSLQNEDGINASISFMNVNNNLNSLNFSITNSKGQNVCGYLPRSSFGMNLASGDYNVVIKGTDSDGAAYAIEKVITVSNSSTNQFVIDMSDLCKLNITSSFNETPYSSNYEIANKDNGITCTLNDYELKTGTIYVSKANYSINANLSFAGVANTISGSYNVNCTNSSTSFTLGSAITASILADKASYNAGDNLSYIVSVKDGNTVLNGFTQNDLKVSSIDIMHRGKAIKTINAAIPTYLKGECNLRINAANSLLGNVSGISTVTVNNSGSVLDGDINLDGIVDIYDFVLIAKDYGKTKTSVDWDGRCNLDNSDNANQIDIKDIAKAALNYNKKQ